MRELGVGSEHKEMDVSDDDDEDEDSDGSTLTGDSMDEAETPRYTILPSSNNFSELLVN